MDNFPLRYDTMVTSIFDHGETSYKNIEYHLVYKKYGICDPFQIVQLFEKTIADFFNAPYAIATDCCTHALEMCLREIGEKDKRITIPNKTYWSVPMMINKVGMSFEIKKYYWEYLHQLAPYPIWDAANYWKKNGYIPGTLCCISFGSKKPLPIGKAGMILLDDTELYKSLSKKRLDGLDISNFINGEYKPLDINLWSYHYYCHSRDAARGLLLFDELKDMEEIPWNIDQYKDISKFTIFNDIPKS